MEMVIQGNILGLGSHKSCGCGLGNEVVFIKSKQVKDSFPRRAQGFQTRPRPIQQYFFFERITDFFAAPELCLLTGRQPSHQSRLWRGLEAACVADLPSERSETGLDRLGTG